MTLQTDRPTGAIPWPVILLEGPEKIGKTTNLVHLSASERVGRTAIMWLGEPISDEYGAWPGVRYENIRHDGTWPTILGAIEDAREEAAAEQAAGKPPFVLGIDTGTAEWDLLKDWAAKRAANSDANKALAARDPDAEIVVSQNLWNDATNRHKKMMTLLLTFPGIVVITARGDAVSAVDDNGRPIQGKKDYRVQGHKNLGFDCSCWIRLYRDKPAIVYGCRSVHYGVRPGIDKPRPLPDDWTLDRLIFDVLKCDPLRTRQQRMVELVPDMTPEEIYRELLTEGTTAARTGELWKLVKAHRYAEVPFPDPAQQGQQVGLLDLVTRVGEQRARAAKAAEPTPIASAPSANAAGSTGEKAAA
jgi:hypothetical protein